MPAKVVIFMQKTKKMTFFLAVFFKNLTFAAKKNKEVVPNTERLCVE